MTTWPGFGFFDKPDWWENSPWFERQAFDIENPGDFFDGLRKKDDPKPVIQTQGGLNHFLETHKIGPTPIPAWMKQLLEDWSTSPETMGEADILMRYEELPFACKVCGQRYRLLVSARACPHLAINDSPEVTEALKIMYPEMK